jgi:hypothetical protein
MPAVTAPRAFRLGLLLSAVFGAPCAGLVLLGPLTVGAGIGATAVVGVASVLDQTAIRVPLLLLATAAALANLAAIVRARRPKPGFDPTNSALASSLGPGRTARLGIAASTLAISIVVFEVVAHRVMH